MSENESSLLENDVQNKGMPWFLFSFFCDNMGSLVI